MSHRSIVCALTVFEIQLRQLDFLIAFKAVMKLQNLELEWVAKKVTYFNLVILILLVSLVAMVFKL